MRRDIGIVSTVDDFGVEERSMNVNYSVFLPFLAETEKWDILHKFLFVLFTYLDMLLLP